MHSAPVLLTPRKGDRMTRDNELRALRGVVQTFTREGRDDEERRIALRQLWPTLAERLDRLTFDASPGDPEDIVARQVAKDYLIEHGSMTTQGVTHTAYETRPGVGGYETRPRRQSPDVHVPGCSAAGDRYHDGPCTVTRGRVEEDGEVHAPPVPEVEVQGRPVPVTSYVRVIQGMCRKLGLTSGALILQVHRARPRGEVQSGFTAACTEAGLPVPDEDERPAVLSAVIRYARENKL